MNTPTYVAVGLESEMLDPEDGIQQAYTSSGGIPAVVRMLYTQDPKGEICTLMDNPEGHERPELMDDHTKYAQTPDLVCVWQCNGFLWDIYKI